MQFLPLPPPSPLSRHDWEVSGFRQHCQVFLHIDKIPLILFISRLNNLTLWASPHMADAMVPSSSSQHCAGFAPSLCCTGEPSTGSSTPDMISTAWNRGYHLDLLAMLFVTQPRRLLAFNAARPYCWLMFNLMSTKTSRSFSAKLLFQSGPQPVLVPRVVP